MAHAESPTLKIRDDDVPLLSYQKVILAHGIVCIIGFLVALPAGALLARYLRTFTPSWYSGHWMIQVLIAGPIIIAGIILGYISNSKIPKLERHDDSSDHKTLGVILLVLYVAQCAFGAAIHYIKPKARSSRPPQNYAHAVVGLILIALSLYQVHTGYDTEWPKVTGRGNVSNAANIVFYVWVALLPTAYFAGLFFLRRQLRQEAERRPQNQIAS